MRILKTLQEKALEAKRESKTIEFKSEFDINSKEQWCEIVKDIVSMSNSGGGIILFGLNNDGSCSGYNCSDILLLDPAEITSKVAKYTQDQFSGFDVLELKKEGKTIAGMEIQRSRIPMIFAIEGTYPIGTTKKTAFARGTLYFRHGAKSEPADSHDLEKVIQREVTSATDSILSRINTIAALPLDKDVIVSTAKSKAEPTVSVVLSDDPNATKMGLLDTNTTHPHRQKDIVDLVNKRLKGKKHINSHDIQCFRYVYDIDDDIRYCYKPLHTSPHYSPLFVDVIMNKFEKDDAVFEKAREKYHF